MRQSKVLSSFIGGSLAVALAFGATESVSHAAKKTTTHVTTHVTTQETQNHSSYSSSSSSDSGFHFSSSVIPSTTRGHWQVGGAVSLYNTWFNNYSVLNFTVGAPVEYFIMDKLSVGGAVGFTHSSRSPGTSLTDFDLGPSATYYFWTDGPLTAYGNVQMNYYFLDRSEDALGLKAAAGARYFLTPSLAAGPELSYIHLFGMGNATDSNTIAFGATFSLFL